MSEQFPLPGLEPIEKAKNSLFFVFFPDAETAAHIAKLAPQLREMYGLKGKVPEAERFHVSVLNLQEYAELPASIVDRAREAAASVRVPPFELVFDRAGSFHRKDGNPFVLRASKHNLAFTAFQQTLKQKMAKALAGQGIKMSFTPLHLTLLYDDKIITEESTETVRWTAQEFALVYSEYRKTRYLIQGSWPLQAPDPR